MGSNRFITDDDDTVISMTFPSREESMELGDSAEVESGGLLSQYEDAEEVRFFSFDLWLLILIANLILSNWQPFLRTNLNNAYKLK